MYIHTFSTFRQQWYLLELDLKKERFNYNLSKMILVGSERYDAVADRDCQRISDGHAFFKHT